MPLLAVQPKPYILDRLPLLQVHPLIISLQFQLRHRQWLRIDILLLVEYPGAGVFGQYFQRKFVQVGFVSLKVDQPAGAEHLLVGVEKTGGGKAAVGLAFAQEGVGEGSPDLRVGCQGSISACR